MSKMEVLLVVATASTTVTVSILLNEVARSVKKLGKAVERKASELTETDVVRVQEVAEPVNKYIGKGHPDWISKL